MFNSFKEVKIEGSKVGKEEKRWCILLANCFDFLKMDETSKGLFVEYTTTKMINDMYVEVIIRVCKSEDKLLK